MQEKTLKRVGLGNCWEPEYFGPAGALGWLEPSPHRGLWMFQAYRMNILAQFFFVAVQKPSSTIWTQLSFFPVFYCFYCNIVFQKLPWCQDHRVCIFPSFRSFHGAVCPSYHHDLIYEVELFAISTTFFPISVGNPLEPYCCLFPYLYLSWYTLICA